jgi:hypothetical protein
MSGFFLAMEAIGCGSTACIPKCGIAGLRDAAEDGVCNLKQRIGGARSCVTVCGRLRLREREGLVVRYY